MQEIPVTALQREELVPTISISGTSIKAEAVIRRVESWTVQIHVVEILLAYNWAQGVV